MKSLYAILLLSALSLSSCKKDNPNEVTIITKYKTQPNKNVDALVALKKFIDATGKEDSFMDATIYVDPEDNSNIMVQERWKDVSNFRNGHMASEHAREFSSSATAFLVGSPDISVWKLNSKYK